MKRICLILVTFLAFSCTDENIVEPIKEDVIINSLRSSLIIPQGEWENWASVKLVNIDNPVNVPWNRMTSATTIPDKIRFDIKAEDGWILLRNTISEKQPKLNYLIFYNQFTGFLKGFYYLETASVGNNAYWRIYFDSGSQKLLYNQDGFFTYPVSLNKEISGVNIMNITDNPVKGFTEGWNCFQVELTFDPLQPNLTLGITAFQQNIGSIVLKGDYNSTSSGTIISSPSSSSSIPTALDTFNKSTITAVADSAKNWILSNISIGGSKKPIKNVLQNTITSIVNNDMKSYVSSGISLIFGSFMGSSVSTATTNNYTLQFKTSGEISLTGRTENPSTTSIPSLKISIDNERKLGIWNLPNAPVVEVNKYAVLKDISMFYNNSYLYKYDFTKFIVYNRSIPVINPSLSPYMTNYKYSFIYSNGHMKNEIYNSTSNSKKELQAENKSKIELSKYVNFYADNQSGDYLNFIIYQNDSSLIRFHNRGGMPYMSYSNNAVFDVLPNSAYGNQNEPAYNLASTKNVMNTEDIKVSIEYTILVNGVSKTFYSTRTYDPDYEFASNLSYRPYLWTAKDLMAYFKK
ncbi:hypothetical protein CLV62_10990 [Dysgonomonas alginatilytica]|uniref:Uncharacterized protein n=1 Tax=Dysgonomonas alginatilytica TaxID=1605892 RepID=A0A2V3PR50_9BACT|nr:hypothetical protein [Dysgonomonas alginatilytica]PXV64764.1 hypothetical protein CLV62_10990 [Dysgonomonas alginatilytica]